MRVIIPSGTIGVSATSEYGNFAASRMLNQNLGQVWQGDTYQETLTISAPPGANALALFGTNALSVEVTAMSGYVQRAWAGASAGINWANDRAWSPGGAANYLDITNLNTYSNDLTGWWTVNTPTVTTVSGYDANHTATQITDDDTGSVEWVGKDIAVSPLSATCMRFFVKKEVSVTANASLSFMFTVSGSPADESTSISINLQSGAAILDGDDTGTGQFQVNDDDTRWEILISATPVSSLNDKVESGVFPAVYDLDTTSWNSTNTGTMTIENVELYQNRGISDIAGTDPLFSGTAPAVRSSITTYTYLGPTINSYWLEWAASSSVLEIHLQLTGPSAGRVYAGVLAAGTVTALPNPKYGLQEQYKEYAVHQQSKLGPAYYKMVAMARAYNWEILVGRDREFYTLMNDIIYRYGSQPFAWKITTITGDSTDPNRIIWGSPFMQLPHGVHAYPNNSKISGYLQEFL